MKKLIFNIWTFVLVVLTFLLVCFLTTGFRNNTYGDIVINFFSGMLLISLVVNVIIHDNIPRKLKYLVYGFFIMVVMVSMTSCSTSGYGCKGKSKSITGYKSNLGFGY